MLAGTLGALRRPVPSFFLGEWAQEFPYGPFHGEIYEGEATLFLFQLGDSRPRWLLEVRRTFAAGTAPYTSRLRRSMGWLPQSRIPALLLVVAVPAVLLS